jgi:hypothetical protein
MTGSGCCLQLSKIGPTWGPTGEDLAVFRLAWVGSKVALSGNIRQALGALGSLLGDHLVTIGVRVIALSSTTPSSWCLSAPKGAVLGLFAPRWAELRRPIMYNFARLSSRCFAEGNRILFGAGGLV